MLIEQDLTPHVAAATDRARELVRRFAQHGGVVDPDAVDRAPHRMPTPAEWEEALYLVHVLAGWADGRHDACLSLARDVEILKAHAQCC